LRNSLVYQEAKGSLITDNLQGGYRMGGTIDFIKLHVLRFNSH